MTQTIFGLSSHHSCRINCPIKFNDQFITTEEEADAYLDSIDEKPFRSAHPRDDWKRETLAIVDKFTHFRSDFQAFIQSSLESVRHDIEEAEDSFIELKSVDFLFYLEFLDFDTRCRVRTKQHFVGSIKDFLAKNFEILDLFNPKHRVSEIRGYGVSCYFSPNDLEKKFDCSEQSLTLEALNDGYSFEDINNQGMV